MGSGAQIVSLALPQSPLVCLDLWCRAGSVFEDAGESGMAHFLEHMVFKGSQRLQAGDFDRRIEALGGSSNAATGFDDVHYHVLIPPGALLEASDLLVNLVFGPRLDCSDFHMERQVVLEELAQSQDQPEEKALQSLLELACGSHPYGRPILGERQALLAHTPEAMRSFQQRHYRRENCVMALSGAITPSSIAALQAHLEGSEFGQLASAEHRQNLPPLAVKAGHHHVAIKRLESARLLMAWALPPASQLPAVMAMDLATTLLAEGRRSRLVERLREDLRIVESIDLDLHVLECGSLALLEAVCEPDELLAVQAAIGEVWDDVMGAPISAVEFERSRRLVANSYCFGLEAAGGVASLIGNGTLWKRSDDLAAPLRELDQLDPASLQAHWLSLLNPAQACVLQAVPQ